MGYRRGMLQEFIVVIDISYLFFIPGTTERDEGKEAEEEIFHNVKSLKGPV